MLASLRHALGIAAAVAVILLITMLPFLPGSYDPLAVTLSSMARVFGFVGLLVVPFAFSRWGRSALALAVLLVVLSAFRFGSVSFGVICALAFTFVATSARTRVPAAYLLIVPLAVFGLQWLLMPEAVEWSRNRAIANAASLIADIETYGGAAAPVRHPCYRHSVTTSRRSSVLIATITGSGCTRRRPQRGLQRSERSPQASEPSDVTRRLKAANERRSPVSAVDHTRSLLVLPKSSTSRE